jgi:hypothetical protein
MKPLNPSQKETQKSLQTTQNCQECVEKDASIKTLKQLVNVLENTIADKMQIIAAKEKSIQLLELILYPKNSH